MHTGSQDGALPQVGTLSKTDETSPLLSSPSKTGKFNTSCLSPGFLRTSPKKKQDVEERAAGHASSEEESSGRSETQDDAPSEKVSVMSFIAVLYFGIFPAPS